MSGMELADLARGLPGARTGWNWIINPGFTVNQRGAVTKAQSAGVYGYDRWKGGSTSGTLQQVVEALPAGEYVLRVTDDAVVTESAVSHAGGNYTVTIPDTATWVELTEARVMRADIRPPPVELALCQYYACVVQCGGRFTAQAASDVVDWTLSWPAMRTTPSATQTAAGTVTNLASASLTALNRNYGLLRLTSTSSGGCQLANRLYLLSAEL